MTIVERGEPKAYIKEHPTRLTTTYLVFQLGPGETVGELLERAKFEEKKSEGWKYTVYDLRTGYLRTMNATIEEAREKGYELERGKFNFVLSRVNAQPLNAPR